MLEIAGSDLRLRSVKGEAIGVEQVARIVMPHAGEVVEGDMRDGRIALSSSEGGTLTGRVEIVTIESGDVELVTSSTWSGGVAQGAVLVGDTVVFNDQDRIPDGSWRTRWRLVAHDLETGEDRILSESDGVETWSPVPHSDGEALIWSELEDAADPDKGAVVYRWHPGDSKAKPIVRHAYVDQFNLQNVGDTLVSPGFSGMKTRRGRGIDLYAHDLETGERRRLTHHGLVYFNDVTDGRVAWSEYDPAPDADSDDAYSQWTMTLDGSQPGPVKLQEGYSGGNTTAGENYVAWWPMGEGIVLSSPDGQRRSVLRYRHHAYVPFRMRGDGDLLAFATQTENRDDPIVIYVVRIST